MTYDTHQVAALERILTAVEQALREFGRDSVEHQTLSVLRRSLLTALGERELRAAG